MKHHKETQHVQIVSAAKSPPLSSSDFLPAIIHELKNPLNAILGFSQLLHCEIKNKNSAEECADYANEITIAAKELNELIHDLLDVGAANSGIFSADISKKISIQDVIRRSIKLNYDYAAARSIVIKSKVSNDIGLVNLDAKRMKQIITNLISNAVKYSPHKTEIEVKAQITDQKLEITISDQGFGMTESQVKTAFVKYKTIQNPNSGKVDSFGLGLPITKHLVELQKGTIGVESEPNKGTKIKLSFPVQM